MKGWRLQDISLEEGLTLTCIKSTSGLCAPYYIEGKDYEVVRRGELLGLILEDGYFSSSSGSLFTIKKKVLPLRNVKIDLRDTDGTVDQEKSKVFQEAVFESGGWWTISGRSVKHLDYCFLYINDEGVLSCDDDPKYFSQKPQEEITFSYTRKLSYEVSLKEDIITEKELKLNKVITDLEEQLGKAKLSLKEVRHDRN